MISWLMAQVSLLDLAMAFFVVEVIITTMQVAATAIFCSLFFTEFSVFLTSLDGFLAGIDVAAWIVNFGVAAVSFVYDSVELPCYVHMMVAGFTFDFIYVFRLLFALFMRSPLASAPEMNLTSFSTWSLLYTCLALILVVVHITFSFVLASFAKKYRKKNRRFFKMKNF